MKFPTTGDLVAAARQSFSITTGCSENILNVYDEKKGNPKLLQMELTPTNVNKIVQKENQAALNGEIKTFADRVAKIATPFRLLMAHGAAQLLVTSQQGHFCKNEYARAALFEITGLF